MGDVVAFDSFHKENSSMVASLILPMENSDLLLPNVSVAEVIGYQQPVRVEGTEPWFMGSIAWRGLDLPIVSYEVMNDQETPGLGSNPRLIVINTISEHHEVLPFFGFATQAIPRQVKVHEDGIREIASTTQGPAEIMPVEVQGERAIIPDLGYIEAKIVAELKK